MKKIIILLVFFVNIIFAQIQNYKFLPKQEDFSKEFMRLLDSVRKKEFGKCATIKFDTSAYFAGLHHTKYLYELVKGYDRDPIVIGHSETKKIGEFEYRGNDTLLNTILDKAAFFNKNFIAHGECVWGGYTIYKDYRTLTSAELARVAFNAFIQSKKGHRDVIVNKYYVSVGITLYVDPEFKRFYVYVLTGENRRKAVTYYENGKVMSKGYFVNEKMEGEWIYFYENGKIKEKIKYDEGRPTRDEI